MAMAEASDRWHRLSHIEEQLFFQKFWIQWLGYGDQKYCFL